MLGQSRRGIGALLQLGSRPTDSRNDRLAKQALVMIAVLITVLAIAYVVTYLALGLPQSAAVPFTYQVVSVVSLVIFARTGSLPFLRLVQLIAMLFLPFALQWSLGGFVNSSAVMVWAFVAPIAALALYPPRVAVWFFAGYLGLTILSAVVDPALAAHEPYLADWLRLFFFMFNIGALSTVTYIVLQYFVASRARAQAQAEQVLHNVLPEVIADRLRAGEQRIADDFPLVTVLFADVAGFTPFARRAGAERVIATLDDLFTRFDELAERHGLEKIKTIGDAYMAVGGAPTPNRDHAAAAADTALEMLDAVKATSADIGEELNLRIGLHSGRAMAGVIGRNRFAYDLWGDAVNVASRMETHGAIGRIHVSEMVEQELRGRYRFEARGPIDVKGLGEMRTFFLLGKR
jgi:adenylate cyclase